MKKDMFYYLKIPGGDGNALIYGLVITVRERATAFANDFSRAATFDHGGTKVPFD